MKEILIAENSGFCFGVKQAIEKIVEWEKAVQSGTSAAEITDKQIKEYFGV